MCPSRPSGATLRPCLGPRSSCSERLKQVCILQEGASSLRNRVPRSCAIGASSLRIGSLLTVQCVRARAARGHFREANTT
eukprot:11058545-Alexandrium_andersonii.AAC.1